MLCSYGRKMLLVSSLLLTGLACIYSGAVQWTSQCKYIHIHSSFDTLECLTSLHHNIRLTNHPFESVQLSLKLG